MSVNGRACASKKKSAAQAKPTGTRHRCIHVPPLANRHKFRARYATCAPQTIRHRVQHAPDVDVHANPFRARAAMTIDATIDVVTFDADVVRVRTAVPPPLGWSEQPDNWSAGRDCQMSRPGVATDVNLRAFCKHMKAFQRKTNCPSLAGF